MKSQRGGISSARWPCVYTPGDEGWDSSSRGPWTPSPLQQKHPLCCIFTQHLVASLLFMDLISICYKWSQTDPQKLLNVILNTLILNHTSANPTKDSTLLSEMQNEVILPGLTFSRRELQPCTVLQSCPIHWWGLSSLFSWRGLESFSRPGHLSSMLRVGSLTFWWGFLYYFTCWLLGRGHTVTYPDNKDHFTCTSYLFFSFPFPWPIADASSI